MRLLQSSKPLNEGKARRKPLASIIKHIFEEVKNEKNFNLFFRVSVLLYVFPFSEIRFMR